VQGIRRRSPMHITTLEDLFLNPGFLFIFCALLMTVSNVMVGVSMLPADMRKKRYNLHRYVFYSVLICYLCFLGWNHFYQDKNSLLNYLVFVYFALIIPLSRRANVTAHAIIASVGLVLLALAGVLHMG
jgi:NhaP-type Na+/H+ or K+/H+ antiporter